MPQPNDGGVTGTFEWICPAGVHRCQSQCVGAGGAGGQRSSGNNSGAAGGRGGNYAQHNNLIVVPGTSYLGFVPPGGTDGATPANPADCTFTVGATVTTAKGGASCAANSQSPAANLTGSIGDFTMVGGAGGSGGSASGGGGGGAGYDVGASGSIDASADVAGIGVSPGVTGATGRSSTGVGATGNSPGGGGAGGRRGTSGSQDGGPGGIGRIIIRYLPPSTWMLMGGCSI